MDWSRMIGSGFVDRASVIRGGLVGVIVGLTRVLDISHITRVVISHLVGHGLNAAIRQSHVILTIGGVAVSGLVGSKVDSRIIIMDSITVLIVSRLVLVIVTVVGGPAAMMRGSMIGSWGGMVRSWGGMIAHPMREGSSRGGQGHGSQGSDYGEGLC
jgi:hypothetical protein